MDEQKKFSPNMDISSVVLEDIAPDQMIRVYPYLMPNTRKGDMFVSENATTLVFYTQEGLDTSDLIKDENGLWYFEMLPSMTTLTDLTVGAGTSEFHQELSEIYVFNGLANYYPKKLKKSLLISDGQATYALNPLVFSVGAPLNEVKYERRESPLFLASRIIAAADSDSDLAIQNEIDGLYEISFVNTTTLEAQFVNSRIKFVSFDTTKINDLKIKMPVNSLFGGVSGRTKVNGSETDLSFTEAKEYPIWNSVPESTNGRLEMFMKWADPKMVLPLHIIDRIKTEKPLSTIFKDDFGVWLPNGEELFFLLKDMLLYTKMYVNQWKDIQSGDRLADPSNSNYGQVKINVSVGAHNHPAGYTTGKRPISTIIGKAPAEVIETMYEAYLTDNPKADTNTLTIFKAAVVALSRYIRTGNLALGGGLNDFSSIFLPWRLKLTNSLTVTREELGNPVNEINYYIKEDPEILFDSNWYKYEDSELKAKKINNLFETQLIQSERNITQPSIPPILRAMDVTSNPGNVDPNSQDDLAYNWWIPTTDGKVIDTLMLKSLNTTITDPVEQVLNDRTARITDAKTLATIAEIKAQAIPGKTLAADYASETQDIKDSLDRWYKNHMDSPNGAVGGAATFLEALGPILTIENAENAIIAATGYDKVELESFGVAGADLMTLTSSPAELIWRFMKVIQDGFNSSGFDTINHPDQYNGELYTAHNENVINYPVENWMREIKSSWLNKYLTDEAGLRAYLREQAGELIAAFNHPSWDTRAHQIPEADFLKFFPGLKGNMTFTQFELKINGYIDQNVWIRGAEPVSGDAHSVQIAPNKWLIWEVATLEMDRTQAIMKIEIIEQIPIYYPFAVHYKLKNGISQTIHLNKDRKLIFTKDEWHNMIRVIKPANFYEEIALKPIKGDDMGQLTELSIVAIWHDKLRFIVNGNQLEMDAINAYDETIAKQRIIFT